MKLFARGFVSQLTPLDEPVEYEQWIGILYTCAVFRGVLEHPVRWLDPTPPA